MRLPAIAPRPRMAALSTLPVFYTLAGKRVLVAGGSEAAAWKAELLAATGAAVDVAAPAGELSDEMAALAVAGVVVHHDRHWTTLGWEGYALAIGDCVEAEAAHFVAAARRAGVPVNVIDKPAFCDFQFGSVVNRSPVVVGISTTGAAPILGQVVRRRIEALLPPTLAEWAALARRVRSKVTEMLRPGAERRAFWERLSAAAFDDGLCLADMPDWIEDASAAVGGRVTFVTAPIEADGLTIKGLRALQAADVILFDEAVPDDVLQMARREARRIPVGERGESVGCGTHEVNSSIIAFAIQGRHVVRLTPAGRDVSGHSYAAVAAIAAAGVRVSVIPAVATG